MQLQNLSTDIEKINRKEIDDLESDKSDTEERDKIHISDEVIMIDSKKKMMMMIKLIMIMIKEQVKKNQRKKIRQKKAKKMI